MWEQLPPLPCDAKPPQKPSQEQMPPTPPPAPASGSLFTSCFGKVRTVLMFLQLLHFHWRLFGAGPQEKQISAVGRDNISAKQCEVSSGLLCVTKPQRQQELSVLETQQGQHIMAPAFGRIRSFLLFFYRCLISQPTICLICLLQDQSTTTAWDDLCAPQNTDPHTTFVSPPVKQRLPNKSVPMGFLVRIQLWRS